jgi:hypothetical protein
MNRAQVLQYGPTPEALGAKQCGSNKQSKPLLYAKQVTSEYMSSE